MTITLQASASRVKGGALVGLQATCSTSLASGETLQIVLGGSVVASATSGSALTANVTQTPASLSSYTYQAQIVSGGTVTVTSNTVTVAFSPEPDGSNNGYQNQFGATVKLVNMPAQAEPGSTITLTAQASGFNNPVYQYWWLSPNGSYQADPNSFIASNTCPSPVLGAEGTWYFTCYALESGSADSYPLLAKSNTLPLSVSSTESVSLTVPETAPLNQAVTVTGNASNITDPLYQFWVQDPQTGHWSSTQFQSSNTHTFTPTDRGGWKVIVYAQPSGGGFA